MKVLIVSHNPITTYQNMGKTFLSLFSSFKKEELCQLYIYPTIPDIDVCQSYFRITDRDVMQSYARLGKVRSQMISKDRIDKTQHTMYENEAEAEFYKKNRKNSLTLLLRDAMWSFSRWYNTELKNWIKEQKPTCIFLAPGESKFIYNIALKISRKWQIPIFTYVCDEYYFVQRPRKSIDRIQLSLLQKKMRQVMKKSSALIGICDAISEAYNKEFDVKAHTIHTGSNYPIAKEPAALREEILGFTYMGNLAFKRYESLADIGRVLDEINQEMNKNYKLFIYTKEIGEEAKRAFDGICSIEYCGFVSGEEFDKTLHSADVLVHVESFAPECIERVKHSVSTKIADSLGSGVPFLAYGPQNVASMRYLLGNGALQIGGTEDLKDTFAKSLNLDNRIQNVNSCLQLAVANHDQHINSAKLYGVLQGLKNFKNESRG